MSSFDFGNPRWLVMGADLGLQSSSPLDAEPREWNHPSARSLPEESMVTLLSIHLPRLFPDESLTVCARSGNYWGGADILGRDRMGRIHLIECKVGTFTLSDAEQMGTYLLATLFADSAGHVAYWQWRRKYDLSAVMFEKYIAAAMSGMIVGTLEREDVRKHAGPFVGPAAIASATEDTWRAYWKSKRLTEPERDAFRVRAMLAVAHQDGWPVGQVPSPEVLSGWGAEWGARMNEPCAPMFRPERPAAFWLVAPAFETECLPEQLRRWRWAGVDARVLKVEARRVPSLGKVVMRVEAENAPARDALLRKVVRYGEEHPAPADRGLAEVGRGAELRLSMYGRRNASDRRGATAGMGRLLPDGQLVAELVGWDDTKTEIARA